MERSSLIPLTPMWVCHDCKMVGSEVEAKAHYIALGHKTERVQDCLLSTEPDRIICDGGCGLSRCPNAKTDSE